MPGDKHHNPDANAAGIVRTVILSSFHDYLVSIDLDERTAHDVDRKASHLRFPHSVMLQVSFPELDFANRWCWQNFGPADGECNQRYSEYCACDIPTPHSHDGRWKSHWFEKTDYNFGFNEWYFAEAADRERFLFNLENINWGEHYPK